MSFPFPQREIRILSTQESLPAVQSSKTDKKSV